jgi:hypothetical protein
MDSITEKKCSRCHIVKPLSDFHRNRSCKYDFAECCKHCKKQYYDNGNLVQKVRRKNYPEIVRAEDNKRKRRFREANPELAKERDRKRFRTALPTRLWRLYKLAYSDFLNMLFDQDFKCPICGCDIDERSCHVDHCHNSMMVRGLLCKLCNVGLGSFKDNIESCKRAAVYLEKHKL